MPVDKPDFEAQLDQAIATYADPQNGHPRALTARVMAEIEMRRRKRRRWLAIAVSVPVLGCLLMTVLFHLERSATRPQVANNTSVASSPSSVIAHKASPVPRLEVVRRQTAHRRHQLPKLDQFPAPIPITEQERLLIQFLGRATQKTQQSIAKTQQQTDEPLHIAELIIPDLDSITQPQ